MQGGGNTSALNLNSQDDAEAFVGGGQAYANVKYVSIDDLDDQSSVLNTYFETNPDAVLSISLAGKSGGVELFSENIPVNCRHLVFRDGEGVEGIENHFLSGCTSLVSIDLSSLTNVTFVGNHFLSDCRSLASIDLLPFANVRRIGTPFLSNCESLPLIDLSPLSKLTAAPSHFLAGCRSLKLIDLSPLANVTHIGYFFLAYCASLESIDLSPLINVRNIGDFFLAYCTSLESLIATELRSLTYVSSDAFMRNVPSFIAIKCDTEDNEMLRALKYRFPSKL